MSLYVRGVPGSTLAGHAMGNGTHDITYNWWIDLFMWSRCDNLPQDLTTGALPFYVAPRPGGLMCKAKNKISFQRSSNWAG